MKTITSTMLLWVALTSLTLKDVHYQLKKHKVKHHEIVFAQVRLETGNLKSKHFKRTNNLFGFSLNGKLIKYSSTAKSIEDYVRWQKKFYKGGCYYAFLTSIGYAADKSYIDKLKQF